MYKLLLVSLIAFSSNSFSSDEFRLSDCKNIYEKSIVGYERVVNSKLPVVSAKASTAIEELKVELSSGRTYCEIVLSRPVLKQSLQLASTLRKPVDH